MRPQQSPANMVHALNQSESRPYSEGDVVEVVRGVLHDYGLVDVEVQDESPARLRSYAVHILFRIINLSF